MDTKDLKIVSIYRFKKYVIIVIIIITIIIIHIIYLQNKRQPKPQAKVFFSTAKVENIYVLPCTWRHAAKSSSQATASELLRPKFFAWRRHKKALMITLMYLEIWIQVNLKNNKAQAWWN